MLTYLCEHDRNIADDQIVTGLNKVQLNSFKCTEKLPNNLEIQKKKEKCV